MADRDQVENFKLAICTLVEEWKVGSRVRCYEMIECHPTRYCKIKIHNYNRVIHDDIILKVDDIPYHEDQKIVIESVEYCKDGAIMNIIVCTKNENPIPNYYTMPGEVITKSISRCMIQ